MSTTKRPAITVLRSLDEVPVFMCEIEEAAFWETHELGVEIASQMDDASEALLPRPQTKPMPAHVDENTSCC